MYANYNQVKLWSAKKKKICIFVRIPDKGLHILNLKNEASQIFDFFFFYGYFNMFCMVLDLIYY